MACCASSPQVVCVRFVLGLRVAFVCICAAAAAVVVVFVVVCCFHTKGCVALSLPLLLPGVALRVVRAWRGLHPAANTTTTTTTTTTTGTNSYFDVNFDVTQRKWQQWTKGQPRYDIPNGTPFAKILVPTMDVVRNSTVMGLLVRAGYNVMATGDTGTGKTAMVKALLGSLPAEE